MADDDIVQKITITAEDDASAVFKTIGQNAQQSFAQIQQAGKAVAQPIAQSIQQIGATAQQSFGQAATAAQTMGASVSATSSVFSKFASVFTSALSGFAGLFKSSSQAADEHSAALKRTGQAAEETTTHHTHLRGELRAVDEALRVAGAGALTEYVAALGGVTLHLGPTAAALTAVAAALKLVGEAGLHAVEAFRTLREVSEISGVPVEELSKLQQALAPAGMAVEEFGKVFGILFRQIQEQGPQIATIVEQSAIKVVQAQQKVAQSYLAVQQAQLAGRQTSLQIAQLQQQLAYLPQIQAIESKRADLAVRDAEARLKVLQIQKQLREGTIDEEDAQEQLDKIQEDSLKREMEKAQLDVENARLQQQMLPQQQALQERQLELQAQSLQLQQQANQQAQARAQVELRLAEILERVAKANDIGPLIEKMRQALQGVPQTFDPLTTAASKAQAAMLALSQLPRDKVIPAFAELMKAVDPLTRLQLGEAFKISPQGLEALKEVGGHLTQLAEGIKAIDAHALEELSAQLTRLGGAASNAAQGAGSLAAANLAATLRAINDQAEKGFVQNLKDYADALLKLGMALTPAGNVQQSVDMWNAVSSAAKKLVTEDIPALWNALTDSSKKAGDDSGRALVQGFADAQQPIKGVIDNIMGWLAQLSQAAANVQRQLQGLQTNSGGSPQQRATGGMIYGPAGNDNVPILATAGEFVVRLAAVQKYGAGFLHAVNDMRLASVPRYASGGFVGLTPQLPSVATAMPSGPTTGQRVINLTIEGRTFPGLRADVNVAESLERFAIHSQIASAGRKQTWRK
jgi:hypothetical protein